MSGKTKLNKIAKWWEHIEIFKLYYNKYLKNKFTYICKFAIFGIIKKPQKIDSDI